MRGLARRGSVTLFLVTVTSAQIAPAFFAGVLAQGERGVASVYSYEAGSKTASGQKLDPEALTGAHRTLPFGTQVRVVNRRTGASAVVTINDRGPFTRGRIIDVTPAAARLLGISGTGEVTIEYGE
jgi:rare lipoprotein A